MKKILLVVLLLAGNSAFAGGAVSYNCIGKDKVSGSSIAFDVMFAGHSAETGYTEQTVNITRAGGVDTTGELTIELGSSNKIDFKPKNSSRVDFDVNAVFPKKGLNGGKNMNIKAVCVLG